LQPVRNATAKAKMTGKENFAAQFISINKPSRTHAICNNVFRVVRISVSCRVV
jgi:hypothetical protein